MSGAQPQLSQTVLQNTLMQRIGMNTNNIFLQYFMSLIAMSILGFITTKLPLIKQKINHYYKWYFEPQYPTIKFAFTKQKNASTIYGTTNAILAWLEHIKKSIKNYKMDSSNTVKTIKSMATQSHYNQKTRKYELKSNWIPDQIEPFLIDDNIWVKLTHINLKSQSGESYSVDEYTLSVFSPKGMKYLLHYHDNLVTEFEKRLKSQFERQAHIFTFDSYDSKTNVVKWTFREFSSSRKLTHIWFNEKDNFIKAYNNFLFKKFEYDNRGDPYTFSCLLYGPPGCGKTSILKALINYDKNRNVTSHLFVVPFSKVESCSVFEKIMLDNVINGTNIPMNQRIYVFEDFDANDQAGVFNIRESLKNNDLTPYKSKRKKGKTDTDSNDETKSDEKKDDIKSNDTKKDVQGPVDKQTKMANALVSVLKSELDDKNSSDLSLSDILNTLDGLCERTGQRCVWTTNKSPPQEHFDPAFLRPGRMDMIIKLGKCSHNGIKYLINNYFNSNIDNDDIKQNINIDLKGIDEYRFTPAQIKQICKEGITLENTLKIIKEICNPSLKLKDNINKLNNNQLLIPTKVALSRSLSEPNKSINITTKTHAGHWFKPDIETIDDVILIDNGNKIND